MNWFLRRMREPSTWAGLAAVVTGVGQVVGTDLSAAGELVAREGASLSGLAAAVVGVGAILMREKGEG